MELVKTQLLVFQLLLLVLFSFLPQSFKSQTASDTDTIILNQNSSLLPYRICNFTPNMGFLDSIKVKNQIINKGNQKYYLKIFNDKGVLLLEGDFFDQFPSGVLIKYNENGLIVDSLTYKLIQLKHPRKEKCVAKSPARRFMKSVLKSTYYVSYKSEQKFPYIHYEYQKEKLRVKTIYNEKIKEVIHYNSKGEVIKRETFP